MALRVSFMPYLPLTLGVSIPTYAESKILHHISHAHSTHILLAVPVRQKILDAAIGIDLHSAQVVISVNETSLLSEFLSEGIAQVVSGIGGDQEHGFAGFGKLDGERARGRGLTHTTFATDEDPAEGFLVDDRLERGIHVEIVTLDHGGGRHGDVCGA